MSSKFDLKKEEERNQRTVHRKDSNESMGWERLSDSDSTVVAACILQILKPRNVYVLF